MNFKTVKELFFAPFGFARNKANTPDEQEIEMIFDDFDLSKQLLLKNTKDISGGQRQRIVLASCILLKKPLLLIDEPTSALDEDNKQKVTDYILSNKEITVITATHDNYWIGKSDKTIEL